MFYEDENAAAAASTNKWFNQLELQVKIVLETCNACIANEQKLEA